MEVVLQDDSTVDLRESGSLLHRLFTKTQSGLELDKFIPQLSNVDFQTLLLLYTLQEI
jgi:hypothetical protein